MRAHPMMSTRGSALLGAFFFIAVGLLFANTQIMRAVTHNRHTIRLVDSTRALDMAQAGVEQFRDELYRFLYQEVYLQANEGDARASMAWFDTLESRTEQPACPLLNAAGRFESSQLASPLRQSDTSFTVTLAPVADPIVGENGTPMCANQTVCEVIVRAEGTVRGVTRAIHARLRFELKIHDAFKYVYFLDNYGYISGDPAKHLIRIHGDLRSNGDMALSNINQMASGVNGAVYAADNSALGSSGDISLANVNWADFQRYLELSGIDYQVIRPIDPLYIDQPGLHPADRDHPEKGSFTGYTGSLTQHENGAPLDMPILGDLSQYRQLAQTHLRQDGGVGSRLRYWDIGPDGTVNTADDREITIIGEYGGTDDTYRAYDPNDSGVYRQPPIPLNAPDGRPLGPDGMLGTPDDHVLSISSRWDSGQHPGPVKNARVQIDGPVVIPGDAIIDGGIYQGQGTIYAGRNVHITRTVWTESRPSYPVVRRCVSGSSTTYGAYCLSKTTGARVYSSNQNTLQALETWVSNTCQ